MDGDERLSVVLGRLQSAGRVEVVPLARDLGVTEMTVRRDLDALERQGLLRRVRGGAESLLTRGDELPYALREIEAVAAKRRIGTVAAGLLRDGESVVVDSGTTALEVARAVAGRRLTVLPLSLHAADVLAASSSVTTLLPGGEVRHGELALVGPLALASIAALRFDTVVLSACGIGPDGEVTAHDLQDAAVKRAAIASAARVVLVADGSKFGRSAMAVVAAAGELDVLVTDRSAPAAALRTMRAAHVRVTLA